MYKLIFVCLLIQSIAFSQPPAYSTANAHSHNDYEKPRPFFAAYDQQFGSIEADIFLKDNQLYVAHTAAELATAKTLEDLYLKPLATAIKKNKGLAYADKARTLQLMIDIKTDATTTLNKLIEQLKKYPSITACPTLKITISGNRPDPSVFAALPNFINFDGQFTVSYPETALQKVVMFSDNFKSYSKWNGIGKIPETDSILVADAINRAHALYKTVRFWNAPDTEDAWQFFMHAGVDYINTDRITDISDYLEKEKKASTGK